MSLVFKLRFGFIVESIFQMRIVTTSDTFISQNRKLKCNITWNHDFSIEIKYKKICI